MAGSLRKVLFSLVFLLGPVAMAGHNRFEAQWNQPSAFDLAHEQQKLWGDWPFLPEASDFDPKVAAQKIVKMAYKIDGTDSPVELAELAPEAFHLSGHLRGEVANRLMDMVPACATSIEQAELLQAARSIFRTFPDKFHRFAILVNALRPGPVRLHIEIVKELIDTESIGFPADLEPELVTLAALTVAMGESSDSSWEDVFVQGSRLVKAINEGFDALGPQFALDFPGARRVSEVVQFSFVKDPSKAARWLRSNIRDRRYALAAIRALSKGYALGAAAGWAAVGYASHILSQTYLPGILGDVGSVAAFIGAAPAAVVRAGDAIYRRAGISYDREALMMSGVLENLFKGRDAFIHAQRVDKALLSILADEFELEGLGCSERILGESE